jgi:DNA-nicking Smr family endonuclease
VKSPRRPPPAPDDAALWEQVAREVKPLKRKPRKVQPPASSARKPADDAKPKPRRAPPLRPTSAPAKTKSAELTAGATAGIDRRTAARLRRGDLAIESRVDLHGHTLEDARSRLFSFMGRAVARGLRCVLVITGKGLRGEGAGVIRAELPHWLNDADLRPHIVTYTQAQPKDGGSGAFYVYLRRRREK